MTAQSHPVRNTQMVYQSSIAPAVGGVMLAGFIRNSPGVSPNPMRVFGKYALVYLLDGAGFYSDARGAKLDCRPGDLITVFPELPHAYGPGPGQHWSEFYIVFEGPVFDVWRSRGLLDSTKPRSHIEPLGFWLREMEAIVAPGSDLTRTCRMQQFLADVVEHERKSAAESREIAWLNEAKRLLSASGDQMPLKPQTVAAKLGLSYELFRKRFVQFVGIPPAKYRDAQMMDFASTLLRDRNRPLKEIARQCGFCDEFHFSRRFKDRVGVPPSEFRARSL